MLKSFAHKQQKKNHAALQEQNVGPEEEELDVSKFTLQELYRIYNEEHIPERVLSNIYPPPRQFIRNKSNVTLISLFLGLVTASLPLNVLLTSINLLNSGFLVTLIFVIAALIVTVLCVAATAMFQFQKLKEEDVSLVNSYKKSKCDKKLIEAINEAQQNNMLFMARNFAYSALNIANKTGCAQEFNEAVSECKLDAIHSLSDLRKDPTSLLQWLKLGGHKRLFDKVISLAADHGFYLQANTLYNTATFKKPLTASSEYQFLSRVNKSTILSLTIVSTLIVNIFSCVTTIAHVFELTLLSTLLTTPIGVTIATTFAFLIGAIAYFENENRLIQIDSRNEIIATVKSSVQEKDKIRAELENQLTLLHDANEKMGQLISMKILEQENVSSEVDRAMQPESSLALGATPNPKMSESKQSIFTPDKDGVPKPQSPSGVDQLTEGSATEPGSSQQLVQSLNVMSQPSHN